MPTGVLRLLKPGFPSAFISVPGKEERIEQSKSYQNQAEADMVQQIVRTLLIETRFKAKEIGIIAPYAA